MTSESQAVSNERRRFRRSLFELNIGCPENGNTNGLRADALNCRLRNASLRCSPLPVSFFGVQAVDVDAGGPEAVGQAVQVGALDFERDQLMFFGIL